MSEAVLLDIVIPTYRRPGRLERLLASFAAQGYGSGIGVRITISENGGSEGADAVVDRWKGKLPVRYVKQPAPLGALLHIAMCYAMPQARYGWIVGDDDVIQDVRWDFLRPRLEKGDLDVVLLGHVFADSKGDLHHDSGHGRLLGMVEKHKGDALDLVCSSPSTFTFISGTVMRTERIHRWLAKANIGQGFFPLELLMLVAQGAQGEYWEGDRVRGDLDVTWADSAQRYFSYDLPMMLDGLSVVLPAGKADLAISSLICDGYLRFDGMLAYERGLALWFYKKHQQAVDTGLALGRLPAAKKNIHPDGFYIQKLKGIFWRFYWKMLALRR